jgi:hypothetical protein
MQEGSEGGETVSLPAVLATEPWSMGRWTDRAAREAIIAHAMTMTLADFRCWFARHAASCLVD